TRYREESLNQESKHDALDQVRKFFPKGMPDAKDGWCKLSVEVTPESLKVWVGKTLLRTLSRAKLNRQVDLWWTGQHLGRAHRPPTPSYRPEGCLGLIVDRSTARFRNVILEPLPNP